MNTQHKYDHGIESYCINEQSQNEILRRMSEFMSNMRVHGKKSLLLFQKGNTNYFKTSEINNVLYIYKCI